MMKKLGVLAGISLLSVVVASCTSEPQPDAGQPDAGGLYAVSGTITGQGVSGVEVTLSGSSLAKALTQVTGADGKYSFSQLKPGNYSLQPSKTGFKFNPATKTIDVKDTSITGQDFTASADSTKSFSISGAITGQGLDLSGVKVVLTGGTPSITREMLTSGDGQYSFAQLLPGTYKVQPSKTGLKFIPTDITVTLNTAPATGRNFVASDSSNTVGGTITGTKVSGVTVALVGGSPVTTVTVQTGADGKYQFTKVLDGTYTIRPYVAGAIFEPNSADAPVKGASLTGKNFVASADPMTCTDNAGTWCRPTTTATIPTMNRIWGMNGKDLWFVGNDAAVWRYTSTATGQPLAWTKIELGMETNPNIYAIAGNSATDVWFGGGWTQVKNIGNLSNLFQYAPGVSSVVLNYYGSELGNEINALWPGGNDGGINLAGCANTVGYKDTISRANWSSAFFDGGANLYGAWPASASDVWLVGRNLSGASGPPGASGPKGAASSVGRMFRNQNDGGWKDANSTGLKLWSTQLEAAANGGAWFSDIRGTGPNDVWAVGTKGLVARFDGGTWGLVDAGVGTTNLYGVWPVSATEVWIVGGTAGTPDQPKIVKYTNVAGKETWENITAPANAGVLYRVWVTSDTSSVWLVGTSGILRYKP